MDAAETLLKHIARYLGITRRKRALIHQIIDEHANRAIPAATQGMLLGLAHGDEQLVTLVQELLAEHVVMVRRNNLDLREQLLNERERKIHEQEK